MLKPKDCFLGTYTGGMARKHSKDHASGPTHAIEELNEAGVPFVVHEYEHDPSARAYGEETVEKLGIDPAIAFKTLMVKLEPTGSMSWVVFRRLRTCQ